MALEVFKLFGTIMVNNDEANKSISATEGKAEGLGKKLLGGVGTAAKWAAGIAAAAATVAVAIGTVAVKATDEYQDALNKLQVQTGATNKEMTELGDVVKNVYADNFGESFEDVANSVALVKKNCNLVGEELQNMTELALGFRDAFGVETQESTRAAKAMMDQFGISAEEAFNLMVQGEQRGLDYSGELIDNINEYSVQFGKLGLSANDMFDIFESGSKAGAFNLDKIGDAVKEFSIRAIDGSNTTIDGFTKLGLNADEMAKKFAAGGDTAKEAFYQTIDAIGDMDDSVAQSTVGVDLFGTMWEDLGPEVVTQLGSVRDAYDKTKDSAEQMNKIQYNSFGNAVKGIKRQLETNILIPIGESILPALNKFSNWFATDGVKYIGEFSDFISTVFEPMRQVISDSFGVILDTISNLLSVFTNNTDGMTSSWDGFLQEIKSFWDSTGKPLFDSVFNVVSSVVTNLSPVLDGLKTSWGTCVSYIKTYWDTIGKPRFEFFIEIVNKLADVFNRVFPILANIFSGLMETISLFWENIGKPIFQAVGDFVTNTLLPIWRSVFDAISKVVITVFEEIGIWWNTVLKPILDGIILFVGGIFKGNWSQVWEGIKSILSGIWGGIKQTLWRPIEWAINKIKGITNSITKPFRDAANAIGDIWSSIKSKFKLPHFKLKGSLNPIKWIDEGMPKFDVDWYGQGGIFTQPTLLGGIGVGDANNGNGSQTEIVARYQDFVSMVDKLANRSIEVIFNVDGREFTRKVVAPYQKELANYNIGR